MQVNITKRIDTSEGKHYCPVVVGPNGRIKPDWVMVNDRQEKHLEGVYYLDWNEDGKRRCTSVGIDAAAAYNSRARKQGEIDAIAAGLIVSNPIEDDSRLRIGSAVDDFLDEVQLTRQRKTWRGYRVSLGYFQESCDKCFLEEIERKDLLRFAAFLRDTKKLSPRTVHNKFADVLTFLQVQGIPKLIGKNDHPRFIEQEVDIYEDDDLSKLHAACSPYHSTLYDFLLMSGFREQEAMHVLWSNVRFNSNVIPIVTLMGQWWTFWAVGIRLLIAGVRQVVQPRFTAEAIFQIHDPASFPIVREVGFGNLAMGILGICCLFRLGWLVPAAIVGGLYYGFAGFSNVPQKEKNSKEWTAMASDFLVCLLLAIFVCKALF